MTQEEKDLLLKDICCRLPYKVKVQHIKNYKDNPNISIKTLNYPLLSIVSPSFKHEELKPYLFPLSSMTEQKYVEYSKLWDLQDEFPTDADIQLKVDLFDWLNKNHFDYRGLIEKGLAIDATESSIY